MTDLKQNYINVQQSRDKLFLTSVERAKAYHIAVVAPWRLSEVVAETP